MCFIIQSCGPNGYKAQDEIVYLQEKLDKIKSLAEEASYNISDLSETNEDAAVVNELLDTIQNECFYRDYNFYWGE